MLRTPLISIFFIFVAGVAQATPDDFYLGSDSITSNQNFTGDTLLIARGEPSKDNDSKGKGRPSKDNGSKGKGRPSKDNASRGEGGNRGGGSGRGHNKNFPGVENGKHIFAKSALPIWAHDCGLPPGLAKQNKIPPGWEKKCRSGLKYYDHEQEFRLELFNFYGISVGATVMAGSAIYQTLQSMDEADCQVTSVASAGDVLEGAAVGAVYGGLVGAATGAVVGTVTDKDIGDSALYGAGAGALTGAVVGGIISSQKYKSDYNHCMQSHGYSSQATDVSREQSVADSETVADSEIEEKKWWKFWK